jgi:hypothetical protein
MFGAFIIAVVVLAALIDIGIYPHDWDHGFGRHYLQMLAALVGALASSSTCARESRSGGRRRRAGSSQRTVRSSVKDSRTSQQSQPSADCGRRVATRNCVARWRPDKREERGALREDDDAPAGVVHQSPPFPGRSIASASRVSACATDRSESTTSASASVVMPVWSCRVLAVKASRSDCLTRTRRGRRARRAVRHGQSSCERSAG